MVTVTSLKLGLNAYDNELICMILNGGFLLLFLHSFPSGVLVRRLKWGNSGLGNVCSEFLYWSILSVGNTS